MLVTAISALLHCNNDDMAQRPTLHYFDALSAAQAGGQQPVQTDKCKFILVWVSGLMQLFQCRMCALAVGNWAEAEADAKEPVQFSASGFEQAVSN